MDGSTISLPQLIELRSLPAQQRRPPLYHDAPRRYAAGRLPGLGELGIENGKWKNENGGLKDEAPSPSRSRDGAATATLIFNDPFSISPRGYGRSDAGMWMHVMAQVSQARLARLTFQVM